MNFSNLKKCHTKDAEPPRLPQLFRSNRVRMLADYVFNKIFTVTLGSLDGWPYQNITRRATGNLLRYIDGSLVYQSSSYSATLDIGISAGVTVLYSKLKYWLEITWYKERVTRALKVRLHLERVIELNLTPDKCGSASYH